MKIIYCERENPRDIIESILNRIRSLGHEVIYYQLSEREKKLFAIGHFQMYESLLDYVQDNGADILFIHDFLNSPEYLLFSLKARPHLKARVIFSATLRESYRSLPRALAIKDLLSLDAVAGMFVGSEGLEKIRLPENLLTAGVDVNKIKFIKEAFPPPYISPYDREASRKRFGIDKDAFVAVWAGQVTYPKGFDVFLDSLKYIGDDVTLLLKLDGTRTDFIIGDIYAGVKKAHPNLVVSLFEKDYLYLGDADLVICSHKKSYAYSCSGLPISAALCGLPIVAPDFYYFNEITTTYKLGELFEPENPRALASAINSVRQNYDDVKSKMKIREYIDMYDERDSAYTDALKQFI
jgi:glycosyltransferase involved in cell wall biosynthesis